MTSPVRGIVQQLMVNTIGGVIQPGNDLVEIVPLDDTLLVEAKIRPQDIAFLRPGQEAMVKFTAYDYTIYGGLKAKLEQISPIRSPTKTVRVSMSSVCALKKTTWAATRNR